MSLSGILVARSSLITHRKIPFFFFLSHKTFQEPCTLFFVFRLDLDVAPSSAGQDTELSHESVQLHSVIQRHPVTRAA